MVESNRNIHEDIRNRQIQKYKLIILPFLKFVKNEQYEIIYERIVIDVSESELPIYERSNSSFFVWAVDIGNINIERSNAVITKMRLSTKSDKSLSCSEEKAILFKKTLINR